MAASLVNHVAGMTGKTMEGNNGILLVSNSYAGTCCKFETESAMGFDFER